MDSSELGVLISGIALIAFTLWFFFGPRASEKATGSDEDGDSGSSGDAQEITFVVSGQSPDRPR